MNLKTNSHQRYSLISLRSQSSNVQLHFQKTTLVKKMFSLRSTKYSISIRGPKIWNEFLTHEEKSLESHRLFLKKIKSSLLDTENKRKSF